MRVELGWVGAAGVLIGLLMVPMACSSVGVLRAPEDEAKNSKIHDDPTDEERRDVPVGEEGANLVLMATPHRLPALVSTSTQALPTCRSDEFTIDVAEAWQTPGTAFESILESLILRRVTSALSSYVTKPLRIDVRPVFGQRLLKGGCLAHDGHRRYFRVRIGIVGSYEAFEIPPALVCLVVDALRQAATVAANQAPSPATTNAGPQLCFGANARPKGGGGGYDESAFKVSRSCDFEVLDVGWKIATGSYPRNRRLDWHLHHIGAAGVKPVASEREVALIVIDTGAAQSSVQKHEHSGAKRVPTIDFSDPSPRDPHGTLMAQIATEATKTKSNMHSIRVMGAAGRGRTAALAQAVESALFDIPGPRVVNMSLGWAPEYSYPRVLDGVGKKPGATCETYEDAIGEAVKFALALAHFDPRPNEATLLVAATGNRPNSFDPEWEDERRMALVGCTGSTCTSRLPSYPGSLSSEMFYPGQWSRAKEVVNPWDGSVGSETPPLYAPGPVTFEDRRVSTTRPDEVDPTPIEAPGQAVYALGASDRVERRFCPSGSARAPHGSGRFPPWASPATVSFPEPVTGSSVSSVLVSAIAAETQRRWVSTGRPALSGYQLLALIRATGDPLKRTRGPAVRPMVCRLEAWMRIPDCVDALKQGLATVGTQWPQFSAPSACKANPCTSLSTESAMGRPPKLGFTPCKRLGVRPVPTTALNCVRDGCLATTDVGGPGPQPNPYGCPSCDLVLFSGGAPMLHLEFGDLYDGSASFEKLTLRVFEANGDTLYEIPKVSGVAGQSLDIELTGLSLNRSIEGAELISVVSTGGSPFYDVSPLNVLGP